MEAGNQQIRYIGKIKKYTNDFFRVSENKTITAESIANGGVTSFGESFGDTDCDKYSMRGIFNDEKMAQSLSRTRSTVFEIMICNPWEFFCTFTLNGKNYERDNIDVFRHKFTAWLRNYNARNGCTVKYIFIPEKHKDGTNWHGHGAVMSLPVEHLTRFKRADKLPAAMIKKIVAGRELFNWTAYADKFGFVSMERIRSHEATALYVSKYITKDVTKTDIEINKRLFYASKGLNRAVILHEGEILREYIPDFENDYVKIRTYSTLGEALTLFSEDERGSK